MTNHKENSKINKTVIKNLFKRGGQKIKEPIESSPEKPTSQDKKNYATQGALENFISANNSETNSITTADEKQRRTVELVQFFYQLYGKIPESQFAYLWTKQRGIFSFAIFDETQQVAMAKKAIELSDDGIDIWHAVNPVYIGSVKQIV